MNSILKQSINLGESEKLTGDVQMLNQADLLLGKGRIAGRVEEKASHDTQLAVEKEEAA